MDGSLGGLSVPSGVSNMLNADEFFLTPTSVPQCFSNDTCTNTPWPYLVLGVIPNVANQGELNQNSAVWHPDCTSEICYGVPLYRQRFLPQEADRRHTLAIRMAATAIGQRTTMVMSGGEYYMDTTVPAAVQRSTPVYSYMPNNLIQHVNEFQANKEYKVFALFATATSKVTVQHYVGKEFNVNDREQLYVVRMGTKQRNPSNLSAPWVATFNYFDIIERLSTWPDSWHTVYCNRTGLLSVTLDASAFATDFEKDKEERCRPLGYCKYVESEQKCGCALPSSSPDYATCVSNCGEWTEAAPYDCPSGGCFAYVFRTTKYFVANGTSTPPTPKNTLGLRPEPRCFERSAYPNPEWNFAEGPPGCKNAVEYSVCNSPAARVRRDLSYICSEEPLVPVPPPTPGADTDTDFTSGTSRQYLSSSSCYYYYCVAVTLLYALTNQICL